MRAVLDVNVLVSAVLAREGVPARILARWIDGAFELVVSDALLAELEAVLTYPRIARRVPPAEADSLVALLRDAVRVADRDAPPRYEPPDTADRYLVVLAETATAVLVSGDAGLLSLAPGIPVFSPRAFLDAVEDG